jgi:hypothetical protein
MPGKGLLFVAALLVAAPASSLAADLPVRSAFARHAHARHLGYIGNARYIGVAYGLVPGLGQLGAAAPGYYGAIHCRTYEPAYDIDGNYFGRRPVDLCLY